MKVKHDEGKHVSKTRRNTAEIWACHALHLKCMFPDNEINSLIAATHSKMNINTSNTTVSMKFRTWKKKVLLQRQNVQSNDEETCFVKTPLW